jgi:UPF0755 protein
MKALRNIVLLLFLAGGAIGACVAYMAFLAPNINAGKRVVLNIPTGATYSDVLQLMTQKEILKNTWSFGLVAELKKYPTAVKSGHYVFTPKMNNRQIVNMLRAGIQEPVQLIIYNVRTKEDFASLVGRTLELDSADVAEKLFSDSFTHALGLDTNTILTHFITDNYEFWWNTSFDGFMKKMTRANEKFWNASRLAKADALKMSKTEVVTLASIVEKEVMKSKEAPTVASVYLNRLRINMPLQADPTLVYATRDFDARRVTNFHKEVESPFNTYKYTGLPPGPIYMPKQSMIDAVLNAEKTNYLYFCASPDMSGYSIFSSTYENQLKVARAYQKKLNAMNIR